MDMGKFWKIWQLRNHLAWKNIRGNNNLKSQRSIFGTLNKLSLSINITGGACWTSKSYVFRVHLLVLFIRAVCWDQQSSSFSGHLFQTNHPFPVWLPLPSRVMWPNRKYFSVGHHGIVSLVDDSVPFLGKTSERQRVYLTHTQVNHVLGELGIREGLSISSKWICNLKEKDAHALWPWGIGRFVQLWTRVWEETVKLSRNYGFYFMGNSTFLKVFFLFWNRIKFLDKFSLK